MARRLLLGCCGSVAIFGIPNLIAHLRMAYDFEIQALMTANARNFLTATSLDLLTGRPTQTEMFDGAARNHIAYLEAYKIFLIAPATSNMISKIAAGIADDIVSLCANVCIGSGAKLVIAPAMNPVMWRNPILQQNIQKLKAAHVHFVDPSPGIEIVSMQHTLVGGMASIEAVTEKLIGLSEVD